MKKPQSFSVFAKSNSAPYVVKSGIKFPNDEGVVIKALPGSNKKATLKNIKTRDVLLRGSVPYVVKQRVIDFYDSVCDNS